MIRRWLPGVVAGAMGALALTTGVAWAEPVANIEQIRSQGDDMRVVFAISGAGGESVDVDGVQLTVDGTPVDSTTESLGEIEDFTQVAMLVLDTSESMAGEKIVAAKQAAQDFLAAVPDDVEVGLITFADEAQVQVPPTTERDELSTTIDGLQTQRQTVLYDAVVLAANQLRGADLGTAIVLSDGADRGSQATLEQATQAADDSGAAFDVVSFGDSAEQVDELNQIADASGGTVTEAANAAQLSAAFDESAELISNSYSTTGTIPAEFSAQGATLSVSVPVGDAVITDDAFFQLDEIQGSVDTVDAGPIPVAESTGLAKASQNLIWVALIGIFFALLILVYFAVTTATDREAAGQSGVRRRLSIYTLGGGAPVKEQETTVLGDTQVARSAVEFAGKVVAKRDMETALGTKLDAAAVPLKPAEWLLIHIGITIASGLLFLLIFGGRILPTTVGLVIGFLLPGIYLSVKESRRTKAFGAALPDTLQLIAGSLSAGYSMPQAIDTVVREGNPPISTEFNRALVESRLGVPIEDALEGIADRMRSQDFAWVVMAIRIQREVGGNLAELLTTVAATLRERERLRRQVLVLSAEGRLSAWILGGLPIVFASYLVLVRPAYLEPLVTTLLGWVMVGFGVILLIVGGLWLRKVVQVEV